MVDWAPNEKKKQQLPGRQCKEFIVRSWNEKGK